MLDIVHQLPKDIRHIVYRYIFDDAYRQVVSQYKQKAGTCHHMYEVTWLKDGSDANQFYNWRDTRQRRHESYIYNLNSPTAVAKLPRNYFDDDNVQHR